MSFNMVDLGTHGVIMLGAGAALLILLVLLVASFLSRPRVFCQYLAHMTGISLKPSQVRARFKTRGKAGVRDLLIDLLIHEDLADASRVVTPDSKPDLSHFQDDR
ncbi:MAG TPA: hypothetical protein ENK19_06915 [Acidobacteria bacterium]|nr:hypothetical protein [Acidobacteriota bacterium]